MCVCVCDLETLPVRCGLCPSWAVAQQKKKGVEIIFILIFPVVGSCECDN